MSYVQTRTTKATLAEGFRGTLLEPGNRDYAAQCALWNGAVKRRPALIAVCAGAEDVIATVDYARDNHLEVSVRSGGHNVSGLALVDGGVVIDLSRMKAISIDPEARVARAQPGLTWNEYGAETGKYGLVTPSGKISSTGVGGLALGGGIGWLVRKYGMTIDSLISAEIVTAGGRLITASATEHPDLFWAIRGGGGNFGVAVSFDFRLHNLATVYGGLIAYPASEATEVLRFYREFIVDAPDELTTVAAMLTTPDGHKSLGIAICYAGPVDEAELTVKPLLEFKTPAMVHLGEMPYGMLASMLDEAAPAGPSRRWRSAFAHSLNDAVIAALVDGFNRAPAGEMVILIEQYGGAMSRIDSTATAFPHRTSDLNVIVEAIWHDQAQGYESLGHLHTTWDAVEPHLTDSVYVGFLDNEGPMRVRTAYGDVNYARLAEIKAIYDPANFFRSNQNIAPAAGSK